MIHSDYMDYFREIARRQPDIAHTPQQPHFFRLIYSEWPSPIIQLDEFLTGIKDNISFPFLLCESYRQRLRAVSSENMDHVFHGSIFIGDQWAIKNDYETLEALLDKTDAIANDIECYMLQEFENHLNETGTGPKRYLIENSLEMEKIGPFGDQFYGTRLSFQYSQATGRYVYDQSNWID